MYFSIKQVLTLHANCLHGRQFACNVKACLMRTLKGNAIEVVSISWSKVLNEPFILMQEFSKSV